MTWFTIQVSNHPQAGARIPTDEASRSWQTVYDGAIATDAEARKAIIDLSEWYRHARGFRGKSVGKIFFAVYRK